MRDSTKRGSTGTSVRCATCRRDPATWLATLDPMVATVSGTEAESWPSCDRCKRQAERLTTLVTHRALDA